MGRPRVLAKDKTTTRDDKPEEGRRQRTQKKRGGVAPLHVDHNGVAHEGHPEDIGSRGRPRYLEEIDD